MSPIKPTLGCDLDDLRAIVAGVIDYPVSPCNSWRTYWAGKLKSYHPEVVGLLLGRWDITDHLDNGTVVSIGQPAWDAHLENELDQVVTLLSSTRRQGGAVHHARPDAGAVIGRAARRR